MAWNIQTSAVQTAPWAPRSLWKTSLHVDWNWPLIHPSDLTLGEKYQNQDRVQEGVYQPGLYVDFDISGPSGAGLWALADYQMNFETLKSQVTQSNFAVGYKMAEFQLHTNMNDRTEFGEQEGGDRCPLAWTTGSSSTCFGIAAECQVDPTLAL